jgi:hypothetical protein
MATPKLKTASAPAAPARLLRPSGTAPAKQVTLKSATGKTITPKTAAPAEPKTAAPKNPKTAAPAPTPAPRKAAPVVVQSAGSNQDGSVFNALLNSKSFQTMVRTTVLEVLRSPEGQELLQKAIRKELDRR